MTGSLPIEAASGVLHPQGFYLRCAPESKVLERDIPSQFDGSSFDEP